MPHGFLGHWNMTTEYDIMYSIICNHWSTACSNTSIICNHWSLAYSNISIICNHWSMACSNTSIICNHWSMACSNTSIICNHWSMTCSNTSIIYNHWSMACSNTSIICNHWSLTYSNTSILSFSCFSFLSSTPTDLPRSYSCHDNTAVIHDNITSILLFNCSNLSLASFNWTCFSSTSTLHSEYDRPSIEMLIV